MEPIRSSWWWGVPIALALSFAGCSLALTGPEAKRAKHKLPECDRTKGLVALDGVVGGLFGLTGVALLADEQSSAAIPLVIGGVYVLAALYGNSTVEDCRTSVAKYEDEIRRRDLAKPLDDQDERPALPGRASRAALKKQIDAQAGMPVATGEPASQDPAPAPAPPPKAVPVAPAKPPTPPPKPTPPPAPEWGDAWRDFWKEVP